MPVVVCLEERGAGGELVHDAADAPHVAGVGPAQLQDHLGRAVVPGRHDLMKNIWSCRENIYNFSLTRLWCSQEKVAEPKSMSLTAGSRTRRRWFSMVNSELLKRMFSGLRSV